MDDLPHFITFFRTKLLTVEKFIKFFIFFHFRSSATHGRTHIGVQNFHL